MARKPRIQFPGAIYHVLNRGNYRSDLFDSAGAAQAFTDCLFQTCERMEWRLHAFCLMRNHYHLAVETPRGNLVAGVHWLQSTFGNRFNRFRGEHGRAFQGRYQSILVEPGFHLSRLVDYIHLNPVRAQLVTLDQLGQFRWCSYRYFSRDNSERPPFLNCTGWLEAGKGLADTPAGWLTYHDHLRLLTAEPGNQKEAAFDQMTKGWILGSAGYRENLLVEFKRMTKAQDWGGGELESLNRLEWKRLFQRALSALGRRPGEIGPSPRSAPWKIAIAAWLKKRSGVSNRWLTEQLNMGAPDAVSRYVGECNRGQKSEAQKLTELLNTKVRG